MNKLQALGLGETTSVFSTTFYIRVAVYPSSRASERRQILKGDASGSGQWTADKWFEQLLQILLLEVSRETIFRWKIAF